jgi:hypothetical protein
MNPKKLLLVLFASLSLSSALAFASPAPRPAGRPDDALSSSSLCRQDYEDCLASVGGDPSLECQCYNSYARCAHRPQVICEP